MPTYAENIQNLKTSSRARLSEAQQNNINRAKWDGEAGIKQADQLAAFSKTLGNTLVDWKKEQIKKDQIKGLRERQKDRSQRSVNLLRKAQLEEQIADAKAQSQEYAILEAELVELKGALGVEEAERLRQLDPWAQVGYVKEKLREMKETLPDKVAHAMANSERQIQFQGLEPFSPKSLKDNGITMLPLHEAAVNTITDDIVQAAGINGYSDEMLELSSMNDTIQKTKDDYMSKARQRFNIESSFKTRQKAAKEYLSIENPTADDVYKLFLRYSSTVDSKGNVLGNIGGWDEVYKTLQSAAKGDPKYADKIGDMELPEYLRKKLGAEPGTTFKKQWPGRIKQLKAAIKDQNVKEIKKEKEYLDSQVTALTNKWKTKQQENGREWTPTELDIISKEYSRLGASVPDEILNYNNQSFRDYNKDKRELEVIKGLNGGGLYPHDLQGRNPKIVGELMPAALKFEEEKIGESSTWGSKAKEEIEGSLSETFKGMALKDKRESPVFSNSRDSAFKDFQQKFLDARSKGASPEEAYDIAMTGPTGVMKDLEKGLGDSLGRGGSKHILTTKQRLARDRNESQELTERMDAVNDAKIEVRDNLDQATLYLRTKVLDGSEPYLTVLSEALANGQPIYGIRATTKVKQALAYYNGVAYSYSGFTGIQLLNWQIQAAKVEADKTKKEGTANE